MIVKRKDYHLSTKNYKTIHFPLSSIHYKLLSVYNKAFDFSIRIVNLYKYLTKEKKEYILSKQVLRSGTSIGANIKEGLQGQSKRDYISKMSIALKEASETEYWLELLKATSYIGGKEADDILEDCVELIKMLVSIIKTSKKNINI